MNPSFFVALRKGRVLASQALGGYESRGVWVRLKVAITDLQGPAVDREYLGSG